MVLGIDERIDGVNLGNWLVLEKWCLSSNKSACRHQLI